MLIKNKLQPLLLVLATVLFTPLLQAKEIEGVSLPDSVKLPDANAILKLNGAGIRIKFVFNVYIGALYLPKKENNAHAIINSGEANRILMHFLHDEVTRIKVINGWNDGFDSNTNQQEYDQLKDRLLQFNELFTDVRRGDVIRLDYIPGDGTRVHIKGLYKGTIPGEDFNRALLKVWLGEFPVDANLKEAMLGNE